MKKLDRATVNLWRAMDTNEMLVDVKFHFWRPDGMGGEEQYYQVELTGARIVAIEPLSPRLDVPETQNIDFTERIRMSYETMTVTWTDGGIVYTLSSLPE
jgi:type VI secretion system secreted protein Hcp